MLYGTGDVACLVISKFMGICLQQYRTRIGLHNAKCVGMLDWSDISDKALSSMTGIVLRLVCAVGNCINYMFLFIWFLMFILTIPQVKFYGQTISPTLFYQLSRPINVYQQ